MDTEKYKGYKVFCMFFRRIGLFKEFQEYQRTRPKRFLFEVETKDPITDFGSTQITWWLKNKKHIYFEVQLIHPFIDFVREFYPEYSKTKSIVIRYHDTSYPIDKRVWMMDKEKNIVDIEKTKRIS